MLIIPIVKNILKCYVILKNFPVDDSLGGVVREEGPVDHGLNPDVLFSRKPPRKHSSFTSIE
jgi:hypothetical protein